MANYYNPRYFDGDTSAPVRITARPAEYPFAGLGDLATVIYSATWRVDLGAFVPTARGTVDPDNAGHYLIDETKPRMEQGTLSTFDRTYASIPAQNVVPSSKFLTRPNLDGCVVSGSAWAVSFDGGVSSWVFTARKTVSAVAALNLITGAGTFSVASASNGGAYGAGTFTGASSASAIASAGVPVSNPNGLVLTAVKDSFSIGISWQWTSTNVITLNYTAPTGVVASAGNNSISFTMPSTSRQLTITSHGYTAGQKIALWNGDVLVARTVVLSVVDANTITIPLAGASSADFTCDRAAAAGVDACTRYVNGTKNVSTRITTDYYLPGVTSGIATADDIPLVDQEKDPNSYLAAIVAGTAWPVESVSDLGFWRAPILQRAVTTWSAADALETLAV